VDDRERTVMEEGTKPVKKVSRETKRGRKAHKKDTVVNGIKSGAHIK
jgi:hypothetical protein